MREGTQHVISCMGAEPAVEPTPWLSAMLTKGRSNFDKPGEQMPLTEELRAQLPHTVRVEKPPEQGVPDIFECLWVGNIVSERLKAKLEELEPGAHEFFPVTVKRDDDSETFGTWYILYLHQKPDIIDHDRTLYAGEIGQDIGPGAERGLACNFGFKYVVNPKTADRDVGGPLINFKPGGLAGRHLWRGTVGNPQYFESSPAGRYPGHMSYTDHLGRKLFVSDELAQFFEDESITGWKLVKVIEEPVSWFFEQKEKGAVA
ncbi:imm11 family protein [Cognatiyoonia sp. IB215182]|uniref:imm11 family protein n=1 Tax=Cognatiyoonia sp. IB215182 TaxID=3097353 RepID=UPI002A0BD153|nr:DUF1629 domain-containing protein [Cognatiyoonia sp. IB215182]MDX8355505.1 hypothetical protein [Cognatiyoonia sp. IB215182]